MSEGGLSAEEREAWVNEHAADAADALEQMGIEDADLSDGRAVADWAWCTFAARAEAAEQRAERVTAAPCPTCVREGGPYRCCACCPDDPGAHENGQRDHHDLPCSTCAAAIADPAPREYDDGGPRVREAVERAERDATLLRVLTDHQRRVSPGGPCWCGRWPNDEVRRDTWMDHVVAEFAAALEGGDQP